MEISADIPEKYLNLCAKNGIMVWSVKRVKNKIRCRISIGDFRRLPQVMQSHGVRIHILQRTGFPFLTARYKKRYGIPVGIVLFFAFLKFMSSFIWSVEVAGNHRVAAEDILHACAEIGIYEGRSAGGIDFKTTGQQLLLRVPELSWCSMNLEGCRLTVNVTETQKSGFEDRAPSNLKAKSDGIITKIDVQSGNCVVKVGDTVAKGDLLVSGILEQGDFVHSFGTVTAKTVREITVSVPLHKTETMRTGKTQKKRVLSVFGIKIPLYLGKTNGTYRSEQQVKETYLFGKKLPIILYEKAFLFTKESERILTENEGKEESERLLTQKIKEEEMQNAEIKNREYTIDDGVLYLRAIVSAQEEIACQEKLLFNTGN